MAATLTNRRNAKKTRAAKQSDDSLLDVPEVLKRLNIGLTHLYALMKRGDLPYVDFGRRCRRFEPADVDALKKKLRRTK